MATLVVIDDSSMHTDLPNEEVMIVDSQKVWEMYFDGTSIKPNRENKGESTRQCGQKMDRAPHLW